MPEYKIETPDGLERQVTLSELESTLLKLAGEGNLNEINKIYKLNADIPLSVGVKILETAYNAWLGEKYNVLDELLKLIPGLSSGAPIGLISNVNQAIEDEKWKKENKIRSKPVAGPGEER